MRQVALFAAFILSVGWVAPPPGYAQSASPSRDSLLYAACITVYVEEFKQKGSDEQRAPLMASMLCQIVAGACQRQLPGVFGPESIILLSDTHAKSGLSLPVVAG